MLLLLPPSTAWHWRWCPSAVHAQARYLWQAADMARQPQPHLLLLLLLRLLQQRELLLLRGSMCQPQA
jgi:hypothetical protein